MPWGPVSAQVPLPPLGEHELLVFWCQLVVLLVAARLGGYAIRSIGQPRVVGELLAGVVLGPSVLGALWPSGSAWLFPEDDRQAGLLLGLAWFGIVLLLMETGIDTDLAAIRRRGRATAATALGSLLIPLGAGVGLGFALPSHFVGDEVSRPLFAAFVGIALAISSLPVAARILADLGLLSGPIGQMVLAVAMTNDLVGWVLLGLVVTAVETGAFVLSELVVAVVGMLVIAVVVLVLGARLLDAVLALVRRTGGEAPAVASVAVAFTVAVGAATHAIGLEVVIGAFVAGIAIGRSRISRDAGIRHLDVASSAVFTPIFFAIAGLRVDAGALGRRDVLVGTVVVTVVATVGKLGGSYLGARVGGVDRRGALAVGAALNARGALEIVLATVGLSIGVLTSASYTAIVLMAIATSALAGPLLRRSTGTPSRPGPVGARRGSVAAR